MQEYLHANRSTFMPTGVPSCQQKYLHEWSLLVSFHDAEEVDIEVLHDVRFFAVEAHQQLFLHELLIATSLTWKNSLLAHS